MKLDETLANAADKRKAWTCPELIDLDEDANDIANGGGAASDGGGRTTS